MKDEYNQTTAYHYAAFRPALHLPILSGCLPDNKKYRQGLDIGCGTGHSSIALANFCEQVIGIDPSEEMLKQAMEHPQVQYLPYDGEQLKFEKNTFDVITFAGSLFYAKSQQLLDEVLRVSQNGAYIVAYDFDVQISTVYPELDLGFTPQVDTTYNHQADFSGLLGEGLVLEKAAKEAGILQISPTNVAHMLLSLEEVYEALVEKWGPKDVFTHLVQVLVGISQNKVLDIPVMRYYSLYRCENHTL